MSSTELAELPSKKIRLIVSSADRNLTAYPLPSSYAINFDEPFVDVVSLTLLSASVPLIAYQVSDSNNKVSFFTFADNTRYDIELPEGNYEPPNALASVLENLMNDACGVPSLFSVTYRETVDGFRFTSDVKFALLFDGGVVAYGPQVVDEFSITTPTGVIDRLETAGDKTISYPTDSAARVLGFGPKNYVSEKKGLDEVVQSAFMRDVSHTQTAIMYIDGADVNVSINNVLNRSYAIIGPKQAALESWLFDRHVNKNFNPPIGKLGKLRIRILDVFGKPYNFQNQDHRLEFLVSCTPRYQSRPTWTVRAH